MTFLEAAIEVLRREGKPLPIKQLAELAVRHNLLSVVGRDPETTMQSRLSEVLDKGPVHADLQRVRPDLYGLRAYPPRPYPPPREGATNDTDGSAEAEADVDDEADAAEVGAEAGAAPADAAGRKRRRRRRGGRGPVGAPEAGTYEGAAPTDAAPTMAQPPVAAAPTANAHHDQLLSDETVGENEDEFEVDPDGASSAPLMISTAGDEELTRSGEEREVRSEILGGRRDDRSRHGRHERRPPRGGPSAAPHAPAQPRPAQQSRPEHAPRPQAAPSSTVSAAPPAPINEPRTLIHDLADILRGQDGRPQHVRALAQEIERRKILEGKPLPEIVREVRMALHAEGGTRPARGLRPRVRPLGGGNYAIVERKLDDELVAAERALESAIQRHAAATGAALRRKLSRLSPFSFEQFGRCVAESLGVERSTLVRRGEGVAYFGGERSLGAARSRVLLAVRTGEAELGRRAVGELRAGLDARGFDEGILIGLGRLSTEGREELRAGRAVTVYDGDSLPALLIERRLGVRAHAAPIAYLDLDFFSEINET